MLWNLNPRFPPNRSLNEFVVSLGRGRIPWTNQLLFVKFQTMINEHLPMLTIAALGALGGSIVLLLPDTAKPENAKPPMARKDSKM